jgi:DNA modification methylase
VSEAAGLLFGQDLFGDAARPTVEGVLRQKFIAPPFSVLDTRSGDWQERRRAWLALGIKSEMGRAENLVFGTSLDVFAEFATQTSVFDPVLCEVCYSWFSSPGHQVLDPFAGGSVRGIVAAALKRKYWGSELRSEQVEANREQGAIFQLLSPGPEWISGDSRETLAQAPQADFIFSCPPYGDLEKYSDDPRDLSAMTWTGFVAAYREIIRGACERLKEDRFACFVVGDFRADDGFYRPLISATTAAFEGSGLKLYNHAILLNAVGSAAARATRTFEAGRKLVKVHQNILVFVKGNSRRAADACKEAE